jgi:hypothetical protein
VELIRKRHIEERYALTWLLACVFFLLCSFNVKVLDFLARLIGIVTPANFLFLLAFFFLTIICLSLTVLVSKESYRRRRLTQELSLLRFEFEEFKNTTAGEKGVTDTAPPQ